MAMVWFPPYLDNINSLGDYLHVEEGGVVGDVLEVLGIEPPPGLSVAHPGHQRLYPGAPKCIRFLYSGIRMQNTIHA